MTDLAANSGPELPPAQTNLLRRIVVNGGVIMGGFGASQILRLVSNLILTRLLAPEAFGLMSVAISINIWAIMLTDIGVGASLIRSNKSEDPDFIRTAWTMAIMRNVLVWAIIAAAAGVLWLMKVNGVVKTESIFANPSLPLLMIAIGVQLPIDGLSSMNALMAQRRLAMKRVVALEIARQIVAMLITIALAWAGLGVWALVIGTVMGAVFGSSVSHVIFPGPRMGIRLVREHFDEIFHFGKWLIVASFFGFILNRGDQLIFGWAMPKDGFSLYAIASIWIAAATSVIQTVVGRIFFPAFSEVIRTEPQSLPNIYRKVRLPLDLFVIATAFGAFFFAEPVFAIIYPDNYAGVGHYVRLLAPALLFLPYRLINTAALASGDSKGFTWVTVIGGIAMLVLTPLAFRFLNQTAAILVYACIAVFSLPSIWRIGRRVMKLDPILEGRLVAAAVLLVVMLAIISKPDGA
ncbi:MAG: oligosaccharide flippase family protein [Parvularculaceae bacterium]